MITRFRRQSDGNTPSDTGDSTRADAVRENTISGTATSSVVPSDTSRGGAHGGVSTALVIQLLCTCPGLLLFFVATITADFV